MAAAPTTWILTGSPENFAAARDHVRKWPAEHWTLAFQGPLRTVCDADADMLVQRLRAAAGVAAP
jgi:hypothetical protein